VVRPQLPPGASIRRLAHGAGRFWLATDRGLLESGDVRGPWRRSAPPAGSADVAAVAALDGEVLVAAREAVFLGRAEPAFALGTGTASPPASTDPPIGAVHRAALHYLGLERGRLEAMRRAVRRRGYWPVLTLRGGGAWDRNRGVDYDEAFLSGDMRFLTDRDWGSGEDYDVQLTLTWDLRDNAFDPESIDVSEETRDIIELRDDVLDEVTQLYFERRAVLAALFAAGDPPTAETHRMRLRADELAAGIDAWTGGWFSARVPALAP